MAGRPRKPTPLLLLQGHSAKAAARTQEGEPPTQAVVLKSPKHLDELETEEWDYYSKLAGEMKVTTHEDAAALEQLACVSAAVKEMRGIIRKLRADDGDADGTDAYTYETLGKDGQPMQRVRPIWTALKDAEKQHLILLGRFGLTPSDRSKVSRIVPPTGPGSNPDKEFGP